MKKISIFLCFAVIFASLFTGSVYAVEIDGLPALPDSADPINYPHYNEYVVYTASDGDTYVARFFSNASDSSKLVDFVTLKNSDDTYTLVAKSSRAGKYQIYEFMIDYDGQWHIKGSSTDFNANQDITVTNNITEFIYSTYDITSASDGSLVFPVTPATPTLEEVIQGEMTQFQTKTVGTMEVLTACGVGLMALLVGLVLLPKILYRFL